MAGSISDLVATTQNAVSAINTLTTLMGKLGGFPTNGTTAVATLLSSVSSQVISADTTRTTLLFHNPNSTLNILVAPVTDTNGVMISPTFTAPAGAYLIAGMDYVLISGSDAQKAWTGISSSASGSMTIGAF